MFSTIVSRENGDMYHGLVLEQHESFFIFAFRVGYRNYIWQCHYNYWELR